MPAAELAAGTAARCSRRLRSSHGTTHFRRCDGNEATLTGKHDRTDDSGATKLLQTGPILIRGLGKGVKDTFLPGRPSRHRAFLADGSSAERDTVAADATSVATGASFRDRIPLGPLSEGSAATRGGATDEDTGPEGRARHAKRTEGAATRLRAGPISLDRSFGSPHDVDVAESDTGTTTHLQDAQIVLSTPRVPDEVVAVQRGDEDAVPLPAVILQQSQILSAAALDEQPDAVPPAETAEEADSVFEPKPAAVRVPARSRTSRNPPRLGAGGGLGRRSVGLIVLVALAVVCVVLIGSVVQKTRSDAASAAREAASYTPPPLATTAQPTPATPASPIVSVIGDGTTAQAASGVSAADRWPALAAAAQKAAVRTFAAAGSGYVTTAGGTTFGRQASKVPATSKVVVFFGGASDAGTPSLAVAREATRAFAAVHARAPDAKIIVVGPAVEGTASQVDVTALRHALQASARIAEASWVDPIDAKWLSPATQATKGTGDLTAADERTLARKMGTVIASALR